MTFRAKDLDKMITYIDHANIVNGTRIVEQLRDAIVHRHAVDFLAQTADTMLYHTTGWSDLTPKVFDPPLELAAGTDVTFTCTYVNDTSTTVTTCS